MPSVQDRFVAVKKAKAAPDKPRAALCVTSNPTFYCVGRVICVKPTVLIERSRGDRGGSHCGPCVKFWSKLYWRFGAEYTVEQHL
jgi:hypothetical protein